MIRVVVSRDLHPAMGRRELRRVLHEVPKHLLETRRIRPTMVFLRFVMPNDFDLLADKVPRTNAERVLEGGVNIDGVTVKLELAVGDSSQVEQIVDEECLELHVAMKHFEIGAQAFA